MPSRQEVQWSQLKVGVLVIVALSALTALIFLMSDSTGGLLGGKVVIRSYFGNSAGLKVGAPVELEGVTIGNVTAIRIVPSRRETPVEVEMKIGARNRNLVRADSRSSLETVGVLGDTVVDIDGKSAIGPPVQDQAELQTSATPNLSDVIRSGQGTIQQLNSILIKVDQIADALNASNGSIGALLNSPALYNKAFLTLNQISQIVNEIGNGQGSIGKLIDDDTLYNRANDTVDRLNKIATEVDSGKGTIGKLLKDETLADNLGQSASEAQRLIAGINAGKGGMGLIAKDPQFAARLRDAVDKLDSLLNRIDSGQGTLGQLVRNPSVYNNLDQTITETRALVAGVRQDPKKYLTFRVKVF